MKSARKKWETANSGSFRRENFFLVTKTEKKRFILYEKISARADVFYDSCLFCKS